MNEEALAQLKVILSKDPNEITPSDEEFMLARRAYIGKNSREKFAAVFAKLGEEKTPVEAPEAPLLAPDIINHPGDLQIPIESEDRTPEETAEKLEELNNPTPPADDTADDGEDEVTQ